MKSNGGENVKGGKFFATVDKLIKKKNTLKHTLNKHTYFFYKSPETKRF